MGLGAKIRGSRAKIEASGTKIGGSWAMIWGSRAKIGDSGIKIGALRPKSGSLHTVMRFGSTQIYSESFLLNIFFFIAPKTMRFGGYIKIPNKHDFTKFHFI